MRKTSCLFSVACALLLSGLPGCGDDDPHYVTTRVDTDRFGVSFDTGSLTLTLSRDEIALLELPVDGIQLGRVTELSEHESYDPWFLAIGDDMYEPPAGLRWLTVVKANVLSESADRFIVNLTFDEGVTATLTVEAAGEGNFRLELQPDGASDNLAFVRLRPRVDPIEGFYGLGGHLDHVNLRGRIKPMQLELDGELESSYNEMHVPVPLLTGSSGWGLFVECPFPGAFDVASQEDDLIEVTFGTGMFTTDGFTFHLFAADHPLDITGRYYDVTGYPLLPARWALGPWIWRDENDDQAQVVGDASTIRALDLAVSAIWIDRPYASGVNSFDFDPDKFTDATAMIDRLHDLGFRVALWHTPYLDPDDPDVVDLHDFADQQGYFPPTVSILFNHWSKPIDFTNPDAWDWWQDQIRRYTDMGIEGFKLDYGEDIVPGIWGSRNTWEFFDGSDERTMHSQYQPLYHRVYAETLPAEGGFLLCRGGTYGDQVNVSVIWPGDLDANLLRHREEGVDADGDTYLAVGGLPASMIYGLTLGSSGFPFYGSDTGGYRHSPPDKETFMRWFEQTALSSVMQVGTSTNDVAWEPTPENGFDQEVLDEFRRYARLHLRLFPYEWTYAQRLLTDGRPIQRPLGLQHPEVGEHPWDQYFFGDDLLVAPVTERDARERDVRFPPGGWIDWWTGEIFAGDQTRTVPAPLNHLPLYQRVGSVVPLLRPTIDTMSPVLDASAIDSYDTTPGILYPRVVPGLMGASHTFVLFDGAEVGIETSLMGELILTYQDGDEFRAGALFTVAAGGPLIPDVVTLDSVELTDASDLATLETLPSGWCYDPADAGWLHVKVPAGQHQVVITF